MNGLNLQPSTLNSQRYCHHKTAFPSCVSRAICADIKEVATTINQMQAGGVIDCYAIGGAVTASLLMRFFVTYWPFSGAYRVI